MPLAYIGISSMAFDESWWSVCLVVPFHEDRAMFGTDVLLSLINDDVRGLHIGDALGAEETTETWLHFELRARSATDALGYAQSLVAAARDAAGLSTNPLDVEWVAAVPEQPDGGMRFFDQARELLGNEMYEMAVVAAHIHFELHISYLLDRAREKHAGRWADHLLKQHHSANLARDLGQAVIELLLGIQPNQLQEWAPFVAHTKRRNAVVHAGAVVEREEAEASIVAVHALWLALNRAAQAR